VPVEVLPFAWNTSKIFLEKLNSLPALRQKGNKKYITDNNNYILDCKFENISNPMVLDQQINNIPGVLENGLFVNLTHVVIIASPGGIKVLQK
jgi:ribose 5-phosphate isomerase A